MGFINSESNDYINTRKMNSRVLDTPTRKILISYSTIVAYFDKKAGKYYKTSKKWSNTTSKHIDLFFKDLIGNQHSAFNVESIEQSELDKLIA